MMSECFIQFERKSYEEFIVNAKNLLFGNIMKVLETENINGKVKLFNSIKID